MIPLFIFCHRNKAFLLQSVFYYLTKNIVLFAPQNVSSSLYLISQNSEPRCGIILHLCTNKEKMVLSKMEDESRFAEGVLPVAFKKHTKATIDLCVKE